MSDVWIVIDDYAPDAGSDIHGCYATMELAEQAMKEYGTDDNEFGEAQDIDNWDIRSLSVQTK